MIEWRAAFKSDGATRFSETAGGLNRMTIARFQELVAASPLTCTALDLVPIRKLRQAATHNGGGETDEAVIKPWRKSHPYRPIRNIRNVIIARAPEPGRVWPWAASLVS